MLRVPIGMGTAPFSAASAVVAFGLSMFSLRCVKFSSQRDSHSLIVWDVRVVCLRSKLRPSPSSRMARDAPCELVTSSDCRPGSRCGAVGGLYVFVCLFCVVSLSLSDGAALRVLLTDVGVLQSAAAQSG